MSGGLKQVCNSAVTPVAVYKDLEAQKEQILNENKGKAGIYKWINHTTGDIYIGSAVDLRKRLVYYFNYKYIAGYKNKSIIYSSILKNGYKSFNLEILEYCDNKELIEREQYYIDLLNPSYNILKLAGSSLGFKHNSNTISQMSVNNTREKHPFFGKKHSKESTLLMSLNSPKAQEVTIIDTQTNEETKFNSNVNASKFLGVSEWTIRKYKKNMQLYAKRYRIM
jgi:excinuclease UvrABC nuclease subunit